MEKDARAQFFEEKIRKFSEEMKEEGIDNIIVLATCSKEEKFYGIMHGQMGDLMSMHELLAKQIRSKWEKLEKNPAAFRDCQDKADVINKEEALNKLGGHNGH